MVQDMRNLRKKRCALTPRFRKYNLVNGLFSRLPCPYDGCDLAEAARSAGQDAVDPVAIAKIKQRYEARWRKAIKYHEGLPPLPSLSKSKKGRKKKRKAHNLALRFQKYKDMVLLFLHDLSVLQNPGHLSKKSYALEQESCALERKNLLYRASHFSLDRAFSLLLLS